MGRERFFIDWGYTIWTENDRYAFATSQNRQPSDKPLVLWAFSSKLAFCHWRNTISDARHYGVQSNILIYTISGIMLIQQAGLYPIGYNSYYMNTSVPVWHTNIFHSGQTEAITLFQVNKSDSLHFQRQI